MQHLQLSRREKEKSKVADGRMAVEDTALGYANKQANALDSNHLITLQYPFNSARAFSRLHDCNRHMRTHWRIKPYSCPECHRNFVRQDALTRHLRLDFGHNRCSGYPGPLPGGSSNQDKTDESADDAMGDSSTDTPGHSYSGPTRMDGGSAAAKAGPSYATTTSPTSPSLPSPGGHVHRAPRPDNQDIDTHRPVAPVMPARDSRMPPKSTLGPETVQAGPEPVEEREPVPRRDAAPHTRYPSASAPISFVHRSAPVERRAVTPPQAKDNPAFLSQHSRSYSHSSFTHAQATASASAMSGTPPTSQSSGPPLSNGMSSLERRNPPTNTRNGGPWPAQGHEAGASAGYYDQNPPSSRPPPSGPGISRHEGPYGPEYDRQRTVTVALPPEYPSSPHDTKHHSPPAHSSEWAAQEGTRSWSWEHRASEARHRQSTWSSSSSIKGPAPPQLPQEQVAHPSSMPPPLRASTMDSWQKGPSREDVISRDAREGPSSGRMPPRSSSSYSNTPYAEEPASDNHPRPLPGPTQPMARPTEPFRRPEQERDPRQRSMTEIDRIRGPGAAWSEQRSRSYHELDTNVDPRSRYEQHPNSPQHGWDGAPVGRASAVDGPPPAPERSHSYSGVVGVERMHPQGARYHDRNVSRDAVVNSNDAIARDYRPTRPHSTMEYESDRDAYHRQQRYSGEPKPLPREQRRSMSPVPPHRHVGVDPGRPYEGNPRYSYPTDRSEQYSREETVKMSSRSFRHEERLVMSPISREDQGGYFGEPGRPNSFRASQNYPSAPPRLQDPSHRQSDVQRELPRRDRHSVDMPLASPTSAAGAASKRPMSTASVASR
ncbi:hypothetical protein BC939DRAFT_261504 [Gamsiella multidivaricata]|uniref:uncharacterized protein n=1 Tax=Gamsiella multidivaricata TaxID=101098 RepID=UPI002220D335|nr:uncharacterized protein BC939DRAFT_261504 [Gamsiella multidivaricata]KAI7819474.1 hypothetical protein BC939DRAFT_261504 [Gamsiella multidivaricata]